MARSSRRELSRAKEREEDEEDAALNRDFLMARVGSAQVSLRAALSALDDFMALCVNPDEDKGGEERRELVDTALEAAGCATRALEAVEPVLESAELEFEIGEPWESE